MNSKILNKKADVKIIVSIVLAIFVLLLLVTITLRGSTKWRDASEDCRGVCRVGGCNIAEVKMSDKCFVNGKAEDGVCCVGVESMDEKTETEEEILNPPIEGGEIVQIVQPYIILKRGLLDSPSNFQLRIGTKYDFSVASPQSYNCKLVIINEDTGREIENNDAFSSNPACAGFYIDLENYDLENSLREFIIQITLSNTSTNSRVLQTNYKGVIVQ